jgi:two-component system, LytTR family, response regulator LytT
VLIRVAILDDERVARDHLAELVTSSGLGEVIATFERADELEQALRAGHFCDAVFIDIELASDQTGGIELAKRLAGHQALPCFVFIAAHGEHAVTAYDLGAADYLLKPYAVERVSRSLLRILAARSQRQLTPERLAVRHRRNLVFLGVDEVIAFEVQGGTTVVHAGDGVYELDLTLSALVAMFAGRFFRVHRNWLVPLGKVRELIREEGELSLRILNSTLLVPVSRDKAHEVKVQLLTSPGIRRR